MRLYIVFKTALYLWRLGFSWREAWSEAIEAYERGMELFDDEDYSQ